MGRRIEVNQKKPWLSSIVWFLALTKVTRSPRMSNQRNTPTDVVLCQRRPNLSVSSFVKFLDLLLMKDVVWNCFVLERTSAPSDFAKNDLDVTSVPNASVKRCKVQFKPKERQQLHKNNFLFAFSKLKY